MPIYQECVRRALPVFTIAEIDDAYGRIVEFERLLLPFASGNAVTDIAASLKTISEDGHFELKNLIRAGNLPTPRLRVVINRELVHRMSRRAILDDLIEFE